MINGACQGKDPKYWYPSGHPTEARELEAEGLRICRGCPVLNTCREYALVAEAYGTWGGMTEEQRELFRFRHNKTPLMTSKDREKHPKLRKLRLDTSSVS